MLDSRLGCPVEDHLVPIDHYRPHLLDLQLGPDGVPRALAGAPECLLADARAERRLRGC